MTDNIDHMLPESSPTEISKSSGVRRVNNMPIYLVGGAVSVFLLITVFVAADRAKQQKKPEAVVVVKEKSGSTQIFAKEITGDHKDGIIAAQAVPPTIPDLSEQVSVTSNTSLTLPEKRQLPMPPNGPLMPPNIIHDDQLMHIRQMKMQQFEEAVKAKSTVAVTSPTRNRTSTDLPPIGNDSQTSPRDDVSARLAAVRKQIANASGSSANKDYQSRLSKLQGVSGSEDMHLLPVSANGDGRNNMGQFSGSGKTDRWKLYAQTEAPRTPYELRAGFVIPAILISGINSDLPGQIIAQVSQDIYDTPIGKHKLIPQGSRLVGAYSNDVAYGQSRVLIAWQRIVFPDGKAMDIGAMPGADGAGYAGFNDQVNNHYMRLFASAFLMSGVTAGIALSQGNKSQNPFAGQTASSALSEALGQQLGQVTAQMIAKNLNVSPTLEVRPGFRFNVIVIKDMTFSKPYQQFDY